MSHCREVRLVAVRRGHRLKGSDRRVWLLKPDQTLEIRIKAADLAKNETTSQEVTISGNAKRE